MAEQIISAQNPKIKNILKLQQKSSERKKQNLTVIEGLREIKLAKRSGIALKSIFFCAEIISEDEIIKSFHPISSIVEISHDIYKKLAYRGSTEGIIALAEPTYLTLNELTLRKNPLVIVLESVEKQ